MNREEIARLYIQGKGIEIGAHHHPFPVMPWQFKVTYIDKFPKDVLVPMFPEIPASQVIEPQIVTNGMTLDGIASESQYFVIASHVIEHMESALVAIENHLRVTKPGGIIFYAIPDFTNPFDKKRAITSYAHHETDYHQYTYQPLDFQANLQRHYLEYLSVVDQITGERAIQIADEYMQKNRDIHFHVFNQDEILRIFTRFKKLFYTVEFYEYLPKHFEHFVVIRKK